MQSLPSILSLLFLTFASAGIASAETPKPAAADPVIAILGAMTVEVKTLEQEMTDRKEKTIQGVRFVTGLLKGRRVVLAHSGMGEVNAAMATTLILEHFNPSYLLFSGIAGGLNPELKPCDIVIGGKTAYYDYGELSPKGFEPRPTINPITDKPNPLFFPADAQLLATAEKTAKDLKFETVKTANGERTPQVMTGVIVTGNAFVASPARSAELRKMFKADATEMEGAAVAQLCWQREVPFLIIRCLSDSASDDAADDVRHFEATASANSARLVTAIIGKLGAK